MQKRWWVLLAIGFFLFAITTLVWWAGRKPNDAAMALVFIGYTNQLPLTAAYTNQLPLTAAYTNQLPLTAAYTNQLPVPAGIVGMKRVPMPGHIVGLLLATNTGSVPIELYAAISAANFSRPDFARPDALSGIMKPGESVIVSVNVTLAQNPWWTEIGYQRRGSRDRVLGWVWDSGHPTIQSWIGPLISDLVFVKCGPITNEPPDTLLQPSEPFLKFIEPRPSVRSFQPTTEDILMKTNTPVRKID